MPPSDRLSTLRAALIAAVLLALVFAQTLGVIHRVAHANRALPLLSEAAAACSPQTAVSGPADGQWVKALFGAHRGDADCQSYDHLTHGDSLQSVLVVVLPLAAPTGPVLMHRTWHLAGQSAGYLARGPPALS